MSTDADENLVVTYTVRELLERLEAKVDGIAHDLKGKADTADLAKLEGRVETLETFRAKLVGIALGASIAAGGAGAAIARAVGFG